MKTRLAILDLAAQESEKGFARERLRPVRSKALMKSMHKVMRKRVSPRALSVPLFICSAIWFVGAGICLATGIHKGDWSAAPMFWMLILMVIPPTCFSLGTALVNTHRQSQLSGLDWCALAAAFVPVTLGSGLAVMVGIWTSGLGQLTQAASVL